MNPFSRRCLYSGIAGCLLFILCFWIQGLFRQGYDAMRIPISSLSLGSLGWVQQLNFLLSGGLILIYGFGLYQLLGSMLKGKWAAVLIGLAGAGLIGAGLFTTDPVFGYPQNQPLHLSQYTIHGDLHNAVSLFVFVGLPIGITLVRSLFAQKQLLWWANYSLATAIIMVFTFLMSGMGFKRLYGLEAYAGLIQRMSIIAGWLWMILFAVFFLRNDRIINR